MVSDWLMLTSDLEVLMTQLLALLSVLQRTLALQMVWVIWSRSGIGIGIEMESVMVVAC